MAIPAELVSIPGAEELHDWFGFWPNFHDAEVIRFHMHRKGPSHLTVHTWEMAQRVDASGYYEMAKHVVVEFVLDEISTLTMDGFSEQNVIFGLSIKGIQKGFRLELDPCYGLSGRIDAQSVAIRLTPGRPTS